MEFFMGSGWELYSYPSPYTRNHRVYPGKKILVKHVTRDGFSDNFVIRVDMLNSIIPKSFYVSVWFKSDVEFEDGGPSLIPCLNKVIGDISVSNRITEHEKSMAISEINDFIGLYAMHTIHEN